MTPLVVSSCSFLSIQRPSGVNEGETPGLTWPGPLGPQRPKIGLVLAWSLMIDSGINQHLCLIHRDHVYRVIGQGSLVRLGPIMSPMLYR